MAKKTTVIKVYTDGGTRNQGTENAYSAFAAVLSYADSKKIISGSQAGGTSNRMELLAAIKSLEAIKKPDIPVIIYTDSTYLASIYNKYLPEYAKNKFYLSSGKKMKNADLWSILYTYIEHIFKEVQIVKIKGHSHIDGNVFADRTVTHELDNYLFHHEVMV